MDAVLSLTKCSPGSYLASAKIANYLSKKFNLPLIDEGGVETYETVFFVNSMSPYCHFLDDVVEIFKKCKRMIWVQNDYTIYPPTQVRAILRESHLEVLRWSTVPKLPKRYSKLRIWTKIPLQASYVNWNMLTYDPCDLTNPTETSLMYYGAFRLDRKRLFEKYLELAPYEIAISASSRAMKKFEDLDPTLDDYPVQKNLLSFIAKFPATIYLEDDDSNEIYCSPANRFYESLSAGIAMFFDESSRRTFNRAGYNIDPYIVRSADELKEAMKNSEEVRRKQAKSWRRDYRQELDRQVEKAYEQLS